MFINKKTKIIATIGPASDREEVLEKILMAGADCVRLNFAHGNYKWHGEVIRKARKIEKKLKKHIAIIADIQGPKMRVGTMPKEGILLKDGEKVVIDTSKKEYVGTFIPLPSSKFQEGVKEGATVFLDDGLLILKITHKRGAVFGATVLKGGILASNKGANVPSLITATSAFNAKDKVDINFAVRAGVDYVAVSFLGNANDVKEARKIIKNPSVKIIAKIERPEALLNIDEIIEVSDAIMVARGDLGIETPMWELPIRQKEIVEKAKNKMKTVIVATQMLDSMIRNPLPTRAEVSDVANAVYDSADAVMLSGETASGINPVEAVEIMKKILKSTESDQDYSRNPEVNNAHSFIPLAKSVADLSSELNTKAIFIKTSSGKSAETIANFRPKNMIIAITHNDKVARQLSLVWGVIPFVIKSKAIKKIEDLVNPAIDLFKEKGLLKTGDTIICGYDNKFYITQKASVINTITVKECK